MQRVARLVQQADFTPTVNSLARPEEREGLQNVVANTPGSKKSKGSRAERKVAEMYRRYGIDKKATRMPMSGAMPGMRGDIYKPDDYGFCDEVKNQEKVRLWDFWEQTKDQAGSGRVPVLHITGNHRPILTVLRIEDYMDLRAMIKQLERMLDEK